MTTLNEDTVEYAFLDWLQQQGWQYRHGPLIAPNSDDPQRQAFDSVILEAQFKAALQRLNPDLPESARAAAYQQALHLSGSDIMSNNEAFHHLLTDGATVEVFKAGQTIGLQVKLIDFDNPQANDFWAVNQFVIKENNQHKRLDVVLFVNGLPLVVVELKNAIDEKATLEKAYTQIQNYKTAVPTIFHYNALCILSDGLDARIAPLSAPYTRFLPWKSPNKAENGTLPELQIVTERMLDKAVLLNLIRFNTVFESEEVMDEQTGLLSLVKVKKTAVYHQYYVVEKAIASTLRALAPQRGAKPSVLASSNPRMYPFLKQKAKEMRYNPTRAEAALWAELRGKQLNGIKFRQQHVIDRFIVDFCSIKERLIIEVDGGIHDDQQEQDQARTEILESLGYRVIRFTNQEVLENIDNVLAQIKAPQPPKGGDEEGAVSPPSGGWGARAQPRIGEDPAAYNLPSVQKQKKGDQRAGVVWHTQGSGKSLSMVFYAGQLVVEPKMANPTIVILTDRNDLDDQLFATFSNCTALLRQTPVQATSRAHLKTLLTVSGGGIVFTTIQKFYPADETLTFDALSTRSNIVVVADEAHRSQYGFTGKLDAHGNIKYGNAKYLRDALPNATYIGFTGTPIEKEDRDTQQVFGNYIDIYDIAQAVKDGATVPLSYESRLVKIKFNEQMREKIDALVESIKGATDEQLEKSKRRNSQINAVIGHPDRLRDIARDIVDHFEARQAVFEGKGMIVCMSRQIAVDLYAQIIALRPQWHNDDLNKGAIKVVMTSSSDDPASFQPHHTNKKDRKLLAARLKDSHDPLQLVIVQSMWLTGFDAPPLHTQYIDKKMQGAALMQAIARVNRVYKDKPGGLIVDYIGIGQDLREAMRIYTDSGGQGEAVLDREEVVRGMMVQFEVVEQLFHGFAYQTYFTAPASQKLALLLASQNFILANEDRKDRFVSGMGKLSKLYVMAVPCAEADAIKEKIAFFQAIKARISKFTPSGGKTDYQVDTAIRQIVDEALRSDGVVDIFEAAGVSAPSLDILSDEFLLEVKNMEHQHLAFELLKKLLNDEVRTRKQKNIVLGKKFSDMLADTIKRYHNNQIDTAQVIKELSDIAREMKLADSKAETLGLTPEEYAFYSILAENSSTAFLDDHKMKELIHLIVDIIRKNATVDWNKRDDVRAKLRLTVKKVLMRYGYPPDLARMEADRVLEQSELLAAELTRTMPSHNEQLTEAAQALLVNYESDLELTAFTALDGEDFHT